MLYDANVATKFADEMLNEGIYVIGFSYPVRWRAVLSATLPGVMA